MYTISDDSGFLAIIEPINYSSFVDENWELEQLFNHFKSQIAKGNMLMWATGEENTCSVEINKFFTDIKGYQEALGSIRVDSNNLCLINYESLTMGAQFSDIHLLEKHMNDLLIEFENGNYNVGIVQFYNSSTNTYVGRSDVDFLIEFEKTNELENLLSNIPWSSI